MGPRLQNPKQPVVITFTSLSSFNLSISKFKVLLTSSLSEEVQPVPAHTNTWQR